MKKGHKTQEKSVLTSLKMKPLYEEEFDQDSNHEGIPLRTCFDVCVSMRKKTFKYQRDLDIINKNKNVVFDSMEDMRSKLLRDLNHNHEFANMFGIFYEEGKRYIYVKCTLCKHFIVWFSYEISKATKLPTKIRFNRYQFQCHFENDHPMP